MSILATSDSTPLTSKDQLIQYFVAGSKIKSDWRIGCEHEKFPFRLTTNKPVTYEEKNGIRDFLEAMKNYGWQPIQEGPTLIGLQRGGASISLEPGGQIELSGAPLGNLHELSAEIDQHLSEAHEIASALDIGFLGMGFHPTMTTAEAPWMPKNRYKIMRDYMPHKGKLGHDMMQRTCTTQVNLDYSDEKDMICKMRVGLALQPIATALFSTSPFVDGKVSSHNCHRMAIWEDTDPDRTGTLPFAFDEGFGFEKYVDYALHVPMYFVYRNGGYINTAGQSFRDFMQGKLPSLPGELPTLTDWSNHLTTLFPDVRLKTFLEMRGADCGTAEMILALPSFWVGLLYDDKALAETTQLIGDWKASDIEKLKRDVVLRGFKAEIQGSTVLQIAEKVLDIARHGLLRRSIRLHGNADETRYLDALSLFIDMEQNKADEMIMWYNHFPNWSPTMLFEKMRLLPPPTLREKL
jgi:glutamate--cysteine ligase